MAANFVAKLAKLAKPTLIRHADVPKGINACQWFLYSE